MAANQRPPVVVIRANYERAYADLAAALGIMLRAPSPGLMQNPFIALRAAALRVPSAAPPPPPSLLAAAWAAAAHLAPADAARWLTLVAGRLARPPWAIGAADMVPVAEAVSAHGPSVAAALLTRVPSVPTELA